MRLKSTVINIVLLLGFVLCLSQQNVFAQTKKPMNLMNYDFEDYHFGFILAYNQMSYSFKYVENYQLIPHSASEYPNSSDSFYNAGATYYTRSVESPAKPGFTVGVVGNLRIGQFFDLRLIPSLSFGTRTIIYQLYRDSSAVPSILATKEKSILSTFIEFPLQVKYRSKRLNNVAAYVIGGTNFKFDLASQKKSQIDVMNEQGEQITVIDNIRVKKFDIAAEIGAGFDFYNSYFKFGIEFKLSYGLLNVLDKQNLIYDSSIQNMKNRTFQVSLTFE